MKKNILLKKQTCSFKEIKAYLQTGDILLLHGLYPSSHIIQMAEGSLWSHAAIIVRARDIQEYYNLNLDPDTLLLWESNVKNEKMPVKDVILNKEKTGPMLVKLEERLNNNFITKDDSKCAIRYLNHTRTPEMFLQLTRTINELHKAEFPKLKGELFDPIKGRVFNKKTSLDKVFCSELVAYTYIKWKLLSSNHPWNSYFPVDFSEKLSVSLLQRAFLGNEIMLDTKEFKQEK